MMPSIPPGSRANRKLTRQAEIGFPRIHPITLLFETYVSRCESRKWNDAKHIRQ